MFRRIRLFGPNGKELDNNFQRIPLVSGTLKNMKIHEITQTIA